MLQGQSHMYRIHFRSMFSFKVITGDQGSRVLNLCLHHIFLTCGLILKMFNTYIQLTNVSDTLLQGLDNIEISKVSCTEFVFSLTASIAQLVERPLSEQEVVGLNPTVAPYQRCKKWY